MGIYFGSQAISFKAGGLPSARVTLNNEPVTGELSLTSTGVLDKAFQIGNAPYYNFCCLSLIHNNEIHLLGGSLRDDNSYLYGKNHYKFIGTHWVQVSTLPFDTDHGYCAIDYNNEIHLLGSHDNGTDHYKWNGSSWTSVSTLPFDSYDFDAVIYNNEIHLLGGTRSNTAHYKWNGSSWTSVSTLPYNFSGHCAVVYENKIHLVGSGTILIDSPDMEPYSSNHYSWNGSSWTKETDIPIKHSSDLTVVCNNEIHIADGTTHYKYSTASGWKKMNDLPKSPNTIVSLDNELYTIGGVSKDTEMYKVLSIKYKEA